MTRTTVGEVIRLLEAHAPSGTAESWDNVGLLVGDPNWKTSGAIVTIDLSEKALQMAQAKGIRLVINHHPCIFPKSKGISKITAGSDKSGLIFEAIRRGIAVAACHTNFDRCALEVPQVISKGLGLVPRGRLIDKPQGSLVKLSVFVPDTHVNSVREALFQAGAGHIGNYDYCSFGAEGLGTFRGSSSTQPFLGTPGQLESAQETRLETVIPRGMEKAVLRALLAAHPYEEVAYDLYPVEQAPSGAGLVRGLGYGFWGEFPQPKPFSEVSRSVRRLFQVDGFLMTEPAPKKIRRVAFAAGKGASVIGAAASLGCDLMITGEAGYHEALAASVGGSMAVMELGHRESEFFFVETVKGWLKRKKFEGFKAVGLDLRTQKIWSRGSH